MVNNINLVFTGTQNTTWAPGSERTLTINEENVGYKSTIEVPANVVAYKSVSVSATGAFSNV